MPFAEGESVGPYRITERLGQGGMATVFRAYHPNLDRYVAIKVLHTSFKEDPSFLARFQREAQIVAKLGHPNIVPIYDFNEHNGEPYLVMKFVEGETLKARQLNQPLTLEETLRTMTEIGQALTYAHEQGVLHRDVKPSNILIDKNGTAYLADFGLARMASAGESTMSQDMMLGTPQYISPEQAQGVQDLDGTTDIYSLGVVLYELVVGRVPFNADTPYAIVHDHIYSPLPLPTKVNPQVPPQVERVLLKALAKERTDRYQTAADMVTAFREAVQQSNMKELFAGKYRVPVDGLSDILDKSAPAVPAPIPPAATVAARRPRPLLILGAIMLIVLCLGLFIVFAVRNAATRLLPTVVALSNNQTAAANNTEIAGLVSTASATEAATEVATDDQSAATLTDNSTPAATARPIGSTIQPFPVLSSADAQKQLTAHPDQARYHFALALAIIRERRPLQQPKALQEFQQGMTMTADNPSQAFSLAQALAATSDTGALPAFEYAVAYQAAGNDHAPIRGEAGEYLYHFAQNVNKFEKATVNRWFQYTLSTQSAGLYAFTALAAHTLGQDDQAGKAMTKAVSLNPDLAEVHLIHGILYAAQNDATNAQKEFSAAQAAQDAPKWVISAAQTLAQQG